MKMMLSIAVSAAALTLCAEMEPATPESQGVDSNGILAFIDAAEKTFDGVKEGRLHSFVIVRHGKTIAEGCWKPFDSLNTPHMLYSHSKSFTSTAIGFLVDDGKIDLDERVADIFPEDVPADAAEGIREIRVRDLLTMNVGSDINHDIARGPDWRKRFFERKLDRKPGTGFKYDSDATYMLACIVEKRTGKKLMDFLKERLFSKIGISRYYTSTSPQGVACGGWGMYMTTRDLARFGQLYLQNGYWEGKNIISPYWVALATARHTWSGWQKVGAQALGEGTDWEQGYGFQFWRCTHNAYRADGAGGQFTIVIPEKDAVVSVHAGLDNMQKELSLVWDHLLPAMKDGVLPENAEAQSALRGRIAALAVPPVAGAESSKNEEKLCCDYQIDKNSRGIRAVRLKKGKSGWSIWFYARAWPVEFPVGYGEWTKGGISFDSDSFEALGTLRGWLKTSTSGAWQKDGSFKCRAYMIGTPAHVDFRFFLKDGVPSLEGELHGMAGTKFTGRKMVDSPVPTDLPKSDDREAIRKFFTENEFGVRPVERPSDLAFKVVGENDCLGGRAVHKAVEISTKGPYAPFSFIAHAYFPKEEKSAPLMVAINLGGRLADQEFIPAADDPSIECWPIKDVIDRGYATMGFSHWDVVHDDSDAFESGILKAYGPVPRTADSWGALSAWAWAASRCVDWLETQKGIDMKRIGVVGHSRGGKTALWAGVTDERFSLVCVNNSGCAGAKLNRMDLPWSESLDAIYATFPFWFAKNYKQFVPSDGRDMPYDQHNLLSLVSPRKLVVGSATEDDWAGPRGEEAATKLVGGIHFWRKGEHNLGPEDWKHYLDNL